MMKGDKRDGIITFLMFYFWTITSTVLIFGYWIFGETPYSLETLFLLLACAAFAILFEFGFVFMIIAVVDWLDKPTGDKVK